MNWKKLSPTLIPLAGALLTAALPTLQHAVATFAATEVVGHPVLTGFVGSIIVAIYHALPSPLQS